MTSHYSHSFACCGEIAVKLSPATWHMADPTPYSRPDEADFLDSQTTSRRRIAIACSSESIREAFAR